VEKGSSWKKSENPQPSSGEKSYGCIGAVGEEMIGRTERGEQKGQCTFFGQKFDGKGEDPKGGGETNKGKNSCSRE